MANHIVRAFLLQHPRVECDGASLNLRLKKAQALLFYLLVQKKATREEAAALLWGGEEDTLAHRHLRDNLYQLKKAAPVELICAVGRSNLVLNPEVTFQVDVDDFRARRDYNRAALVYRSLHKAMSDWLGITPLKETSALYYAIMDEWNTRAAPEDQRGDDFLVGRQEQLDCLAQLFPRAGGRRRQSFVLLGEAGVGKSHLLAYFLSHGAVADAQVITTSCFKSKQEEYLYPWQAVMLSLESYLRRENIAVPAVYRQAVSALFPVFGGGGDGPVEKKAHMLIDSVMSFDSVLTIFSLAAERRPLLLVLEDIQWMDKVSASLLDQLVHKADPSRIFFAATCREPSGPLAQHLLRGLEADGLCRCCHLPPFTKDETMEFIQLYGAQSPPQEDKERIYQDTQGNAFLLTQLIGSIMENGRPKVLPRNMEEILSYRLSGLTDEGLQVLNLVAMFPDRAPYPVLEHVSSKPTLDLLYVCQELCRRSILIEVYDGGALSLAFAQAEFRELTYSRIPALSRRILHLNIAQALTDLSPASVPDLDALTAYHYDQGGDKFHAMQYKVRRFKTYVVFNYALLQGMPREGEVLLNSTPQALELFHQMERELQDLQRLHPGDAMLKAVERDLYYSVSCFCFYRGLYDEGLGIPGSPMGPCAPAGPRSPGSPRSPLGPTGPWGPGLPFGPTGPGTPGTPCRPMAPGSPLGPVSPRTPRGPRGPICPAAPLGPAGPAGPVGPVGPRKGTNAPHSSAEPQPLRLKLFV